MVWSLFDPRPVPVVLAMSLGQALGTLSLSAFGLVVVVDMKRAHWERAPPDRDAPNPPQA